MSRVRTMITNKKLHFMHIGKTGGASLSYFLEKQFKTHEICPYFYLRGAPKWISPDTILTNASRENLQKYKLFKGHLGWVPRTLFSDEEMETITFLRDPVARTISLYNYFRGNPIFWKETPMPWPDFDAFIYDPAITERVGSNSMTKYFCQDLYFQKSLSMPQPKLRYVGMNVTTGVEIDLSPEQMIQLAIARLHQCAFVGLTEHYEESFQSLCMQYDWLPSKQPPQRNTSTRFVQRSDVSKKTLDVIIERSQLDFRLYEEAIKIYSNKKKTHIYYNDHELKERISKKIAVDKIKFTFDDIIIGDGWDAREGTSPNTFCWSSSTESSLIFSIKNPKNLLLSFRILHWLLPEFAQKLSLKVNTYPISLFTHEHPEGGIIFTALIPVNVFNSKSSLLEFVFSIPKVICPMDINPDSTDARTLGFACKEINITPISSLSALIYRFKHKIKKMKSPTLIS